MADEELPSSFFGSGNDPDSLYRGWLCPDDRTIAAYVDGTLASKTARFESHLAKCARCRFAVADVVKTQRDVAPVVPPFEIVQKAVQIVPLSMPRRSWIWIPAGAVAVMATAVVVAVLMREPQTMTVSSPPAPNAPLIAKSNPAAPSAPVREWMRESAPAELLPSILFPRPDSAVPRKQLKFNWKSLPNVRSYEVQIVTADGDVAWEGQTDQHNLDVPLDAMLKDGPYFVWVTADFGDGRLMRSAPVAFRVKR